MKKPRSSVGGGDRLSGGEAWFPVRVTASLSTGTTGKDVVTYTAVEVWVDGQGNTIDKVTGRVLGTENPGAPLDSTTTFAVDDLALARPAAGAGGLLWELAPYGAGSDVGGSTFDLTCDGHSWWGGLRSDAEIAFALAVTSANGACACVDDTYGSIAVFDTDSWDAADNIDVCGNEYTVSITAPNGIPTMTLTDASGGSGAGPTMTLPADCWGRYWARWTFPGGPVNEAICTDTVDTACDSDNGFTVLAYCACTGSGYNGPGWYVLAEDFVYDGTSYSAGDAINLNSIGQPCVLLCGGGPHADEATALANSCVASCLDELPLIPAMLEVEFFDGTGDLACLNGLVIDLPYTNGPVGPTDGIEWTTGGPTLACVDVPGCTANPMAFSFYACNDPLGPISVNEFYILGRDYTGGCGGGGVTIAFLNNSPAPGSEPTITGTGPTFEATFTDVPATAGTGVISATVRAKQV